MKRIITKTFILFIGSLLFPFVIFGQAKSITSVNYFAALKDSELATEKRIRKEIRIQKLYTNGNLTKTVIDTSEHLPPDKTRWISVEAKGNVVETKIEQITIGNLIYRKEGIGPWVKRQKDGDDFGIGGTDNSVREFFVENVTVGKEKVRVFIEKTVNYNKTFFDESKTWINERGLIMKEISTTSFQDLNNIVSSVEAQYDYHAKIPKIAPPIKE